MTSNSSSGGSPFTPVGAAASPQGVERRTAKRVPNHPDDHVIVNRVRLRLQNWSRNGLLFGPMANPPELYSKIEIKVAIVIKGERFRFDVLGEVLRVAAGSVAVRYQCLTAEAWPRIKAYFDALE